MSKLPVKRNKRKDPMTKCKVCGSRGSEEFVTKTFRNIESTWRRCTDCGVLFLFPSPTQDELIQYYKQDYKYKESPDFISHAFRFSNDNRDIVFNEYQLSLKDIGISIKDLKNDKILDYGCANGFFLDFCALNGIPKRNLFGFDIAQDLLKEVIQKQYKILSEDHKNFFDYIFLWDVLEHCLDPQELLKSLRNYLKRDGQIILQTPRAGIISESLRDQWAHFLPVEHVLIYSREALIRLFDQGGLRLNKAGSFGANAPIAIIPQPFKNTFDRLAKHTDHGSTQVASFKLKGR